MVLGPELCLNQFVNWNFISIIYFNMLYSDSDSENEQPPVKRRRGRQFRERINFDLDDFEQRFLFSREGAEDLLRMLGPGLQRQLKWPSDPEEVGEISERFFTYAKMPNMCGCVDGTLIKIKAPPREFEPNFVDGKQNHSLNCMAVCGPNMQFYFANANWPGAVNDARVL